MIKNYIELLRLKRKSLIKRILQGIGDDYIMDPLKEALESNNFVKFDLLLQIGFFYDKICINFFGVYLD